MPTLTTSVMACPVKPFHSPLRTLWQKFFIFSRTLLTSGITSVPPTWMGGVGPVPQSSVENGAALSEVDLLSSEHLLPSGLHSPDFAMAINIFMTSSLMRFFE
uniref:Uncharacterized protein n=1 Tax=Anguilla anguilla TaxID=7936 RepID=A0A0E9ULE6_ANGAN